MPVYIKRKKTAVQEETTQTVAPQQQAAASADMNKIQGIRNQILQLKSQITDAEKTYNEKKNTCLQQIEQLNAQLISLNQDPDVSESMIEEIDFNKLFEGVQSNKTEDMIGVIYICNDKLKDLSYNMQANEVKYLSRILVEFINKTLNSNIDYSEEIPKFLRKYFSSSKVSLSKREQDKFIETFMDVLKMTETFESMFL